MGWLTGKSKGAAWHGYIVENEVDSRADGWQKEEAAKHEMRKHGVPEAEIERAASEYWGRGR